MNKEATSVKETLLPLENRVLVKRTELTQSKGKILLPPSSQEKPKEGTVIAVGPGKYNDEGRLHPLTVKVGDKVLFTTYSGTEITLNDEEYLIIKEDDLLAVVS